MGSSQPRVSVSNFNKLPLEIMIEILSRLPAESALECKLVSKPWRNVVQHPSFSQIHLNHINHGLGSAHDSGKSSFILSTPNDKSAHEVAHQWVYNCYSEYYTQFSYIEYDENVNRLSSPRKIKLSPPFVDYSIVGSCNGLICFKAAWYGPASICNPITREYIILPESESHRTGFATGFGYSRSTNEYKVVTICNSKGDPKFGIVQVYTLGSGIGWRNVSKVGFDMLYMGQNGVFLNGAIYWVGRKRTIVLFDSADEEIRTIASQPCEPQHIVKLRVLGDLLCAFQEDNDGHWEIWVLKKMANNQDGNWSKEFSPFCVKPITFTKSGGLLGYDSWYRNVYYYAPKAPSSGVLVREDEIFNFEVSHTNTLVSLKALGEENTKLMGSGARGSSSGKTESSDH